MKRYRVIRGPGAARARVREGWGVGILRGNHVGLRHLLLACPQLRVVWPPPSLALWEPRFVIAKARGGSARLRRMPDA